MEQLEPNPGQITRRRFLNLAGIAGTTAAGAALMSACTTGSRDAHEAKSASAANESSGVAGNSAANVAADSFPVTLQGAFGETTIPAAPQRVVCLGWINGDICASLEVIPVAQAAITWGPNENDSNDWFDARVAELGAAQPVRFSEADGINFQAIAEAQPDVIIGVIGSLTAEDFAKLSQIAPTVTFEDGGGNWTTSWAKATEIVGKALGRSDAALEITARVQDALTDAGARYGLTGKSFIASYLAPGTDTAISIYGPGDVRSVFFRDLGMTLAPAVAQADFSQGAFYTTWSPERAGELQSDFLYTWVQDAGDAEKISSDALLSQIPAVAAGHWLANSNKQQSMAMGTSPLGLEWLLNDTDFLEEIASHI